MKAIVKKLVIICLSIAAFPIPGIATLYLDPTNPGPHALLGIENIKDISISKPVPDSLLSTYDNLPDAYGVDIVNGTFSMIAISDLGSVIINTFGGLSAPSGVDSDVNDILISDQGNGRILHLLNNGNGTTSFIGQFGSQIANFSPLQSVYDDSATRRILSLDVYHHDIKVLNQMGSLIATFGGTLQRPISLCSTKGNFLDNPGDFYVFDEMDNKIHKYDKNGAISFSADLNDFSQYFPGSKITTDALSNVYLLDKVDGRILKFDRTLKYVTSVDLVASTIGKLTSPSTIAINKLFGQVVIGDGNRDFYLFEIGAGIEDTGVLPNVLDEAISGGVVALSYNLTEYADVQVRVLDQLNTPIRTIRDYTCVAGNSLIQGIGKQTALWDGKDDLGVFVCPGSYYFEISARDLYNPNSDGSCRGNKDLSVLVPITVIGPSGIHSISSAPSFIKAPALATFTYDLLCNAAPYQVSAEIYSSETVFNSTTLVKTCLTDATVLQGVHSFNWNGQDESLNPVSDGTYYARVTALDTNSNVLTFKIGKIVVINGIPNGTITSPVSGDLGIDNVISATVAGYGLQVCIFSYSIDGGTTFIPIASELLAPIFDPDDPVSTANPTTNFNTSLIPPGSSIILRFETINFAGTHGTYDSAPFSVDNTPPTITLLSPPYQYFCPPSKAANPESFPTPQESATISVNSSDDSGIQHIEIEFYKNGSDVLVMAQGNPTSPYTLTWDGLDFNSGLVVADGTYYAKIIVTDNAGNVSTAIQYIVVDSNDSPEVDLLSTRTVSAPAGYKLYRPVWVPGSGVIIAEFHVIATNRKGIASISSVGVFSDLTAGFSNAWTPVVSPNGAKIAFISDDLYGTDSIYVMNINGSGAAVWTGIWDVEDDSQAAWSPDSSWIVYSKFGIYNLGNGDGLYKTNGNTTVSPTLVFDSGSGGSAGQPQWTIDSTGGGSKIFSIFTSFSPPNSHIFKMDSDGSNHVVVSGNTLALGAGQIFSHKVSPDGLLDIYRGKELYQAPTDGSLTSTLQQITTNISDASDVPHSTNAFPIAFANDSVHVVNLAGHNVNPNGSGDFSLRIVSNPDPTGTEITDTKMFFYDWSPSTDIVSAPADTSIHDLTVFSPALFTAYSNLRAEISRVDVLDGSVEFFGVASDTNFDHYVLEYQDLVDESTWYSIITVPKQTGTVPSKNVLGVWNTTGLVNSDYNVRLTAYDKAGNIVEKTVIVNVNNTASAIAVTNVGPVDPSVFSPNGDGITDEGSVTYEISAPSSSPIQLLLFNSSGSLIRTVTATNSQSTVSGSYTLIWDGRSDSNEVVPDGNYLFRLIGIFSGQPVEKTGTLIVDNTVPLVSFSTDKNNFYPTGNTNIFATVKDVHLERYDLEIGMGVAPSSYAPLATSNVLIDDSIIQKLDVSGYPEGPFVLRIKAYDAVGNQNQASETFYVSRTSPTSSLVYSQTPYVTNGTTFVARTATYTLTQSDLSGTGVQTYFKKDSSGAFLLYSTPITFTTDGPHSITFFSVNDAGVEEEQQTLNVIVDGIAPITSSIVGSPKFETFVSSATRFSLSAVDPGSNPSGVLKTEYSIDDENTYFIYESPFTLLSLADGFHTIRFKSTDNVLNSETVQAIAVQLDKTAPITTIGANQDLTYSGGMAYAVQPALFSLTASDAGVGIQGIEYRLDGSSVWRNYNSAIPIFFITEGSHTISYRSKDKLGNTEEESTLTVNIVRPTPTSTMTASPTVTLTATPSMSPSATPTATPTSSATPTASPTATPSGTPTATPTKTPFPLVFGLHSVSGTDTNLYKLDFGGNIVSSLPIAFESSCGTVKNFLGLAEQPWTNTLFAISNTQSCRQLITIDPQTAAGTTIGTLSVTLAGLTFSDDGRLWAISSLSTSVGSRMLFYQVDPETAVLTLRADTGFGVNNGSISFCGGAISYNDSDAKVYVVADDCSGTWYLRSIDLNTYEVADVSSSVEEIDSYPNSILWNPLGNSFWVGSSVANHAPGSNNGENFFSQMGLNALQTFINYSMPFRPKGLVYDFRSPTSTPTHTRTITQTDSPSPTSTVTSTATPTPCSVVGFEAVNSIGGSGNTYSFSHTVNAGINRILVFGLTMQSGIQATSVTYDGLPLTRAEAHSDTNGLAYQEIWYRLSPSVGTHDVIVTLSQGVAAAMGAVSYNHVGGIGASTFLDGNTTAISSSLLTNGANSLVVGMLGVHGSNSSVADGPGVTQRWEKSQGGGSGGRLGHFADRAVAVQGSGTLTFTGTGAPWSLGLLELLSDCGFVVGSTPTNTFTFTTSPTTSSTVTISPTPTFSPSPTQVLATKFYLRTAQTGLVVPNDSIQAYTLLSSRGSSATTFTGPALTGPLAPPNEQTQIKNNSGQNATWATGPLNSTTISGNITFNLWAGESGSSRNTGITAEVLRLDGAGNVLSVIASVRNDQDEFAVGDSLQNWTISPATTNLNTGDCLAVRAYYDDAGGTANSSGTLSFTFNGATAGLNGDSFVQFSDPISEQVITPTFSSTATKTPTATFTMSPSFTRTPSSTNSPTGTHSATATTTATRTATSTSSPTRTSTFTATRTFTRTATPSMTATVTASPSPTQVIATTYFLRTNQTGIVVPNDSIQAFMLLTNRGSNATTFTDPALTGPLTPPNDQTQIKNNGGQNATWVTGPLNAVTISGSIIFNLWAGESGSSRNTGITAEVLRLDGAGNILSVIASVRTDQPEFAVGDSLQTWTVVPSSTTLNTGDCLAIRAYYDDAGGTANSSGTLSFTFNGSSTGVNGDSFVRFSDSISEQVVTPTSSHTSTSSPTTTPTRTETPTRTATSSFTATRTNTPTRTETPTVTDTPTSTDSPTVTVTSTFTPTVTETKTPTITLTDSPTLTTTPTDTETSTSTYTPTDSPTSTATPSETQTVTPTITETDTPTPTDTPTDTDTPEATPTNTSTITDSFTFSPTDTETLTSTPTATSTETPTSTQTDSPTLTNTGTATVTETSTATETTVDTATSTITPSDTNTGTSTETPSATSSATPTPTSSSTSSITPSATPTGTSTSSPTATPTPFIPKLNLVLWDPGQNSTHYQLAVKITNWSNLPVQINKIKVKVWFRYLLSDALVSSSHTDQSIYSSAGAFQQNVAPATVGFQDLALVDCGNGRISNKVAVIGFSDSSSVSLDANGGFLKTNGNQKAMLASWRRSTSGNFDMNQDYSRISEGGNNQNQATNVPYFTLYYEDRLICEFTSPSVQDALSGKEPCGIGACPGSIPPTPTPGGGMAMSLGNSVVRTDVSSLVSSEKPLIAVPNPAGESATVMYYLANAGKVRLTLTSLAADMVQSIFLGDQRKGTGKLDLNLHGVASGIYFVVLEVDEGFGFKAKKSFKLAIIH